MKDKFLPNGPLKFPDDLRPKKTSKTKQVIALLVLIAIALGAGHVAVKYLTTNGALIALYVITFLGLWFKR